ncbi:hypothetical protein [Alkalibacillus haloalkaliphilus]|uniref:hypothetical protein n=1 Tax=Alkalibacillus haloalkaliphilus TaxID=94136 RepID=UPI0029361041|nr:hypothetical protein [Alkalibacillus haloalkaliphilus]MDV2582919.1 hypothetical protein [Alkalibacillus haloalkaliphilus]
MADDFCAEMLFNGLTPTKTVYETHHVLAYYKQQQPSIQIITFVKTPSRSLHDSPLMSEILGVIKVVTSKVIREHGDCRVTTHLTHSHNTKHLYWLITSKQ